jgi:hypothetical protein
MSSDAMKRFVWDTSALLNIKEPDERGYSPGHSLFKDLSDGWIPGPHQNIFPALAAFEVDASVSRKHREGQSILREFYIVNENAVIYPIDRDLITRCTPLVTRPGFTYLRGADLIFACIAYLESAYLVTLDGQFDRVSNDVQIIDLNKSRTSPQYRRLFDM